MSVPGYRKENNFGIKPCGMGYYAEVYDGKIVFTARNFMKGEYVKGESEFVSFEVDII